MRPETQSSAAPLSGAPTSGPDPSPTHAFHPHLGAVGPAELLRHIMETMPSGLYTVDVSGRITSWNRAMELLTGFSAAEALGRPCGLLTWNSCSGVESAAGCVPCPLFKHGRIEGAHCQLRHKDGRRLSVLKRGRVMRDGQGKAVGGIEVVTDLSGVLELQQEIETLRRRAFDRQVSGEMVGRHPVMQALEARITLAARSDSSVLIGGETGTGKELVARAIHQRSHRAKGPFVRVSCAALNEGLLESELFGHVKGAFTGALVDREGRFEAASGGTIFLDEIGDVPMATQARLLRVLQERQIERVGQNAPVSVDIRVISATNRDLLALCDQGVFRWDLYYRLCVIPLTAPALRDRKSDLPMLVRAFVARLNEQLGRDITGVSAAALAAIMAHDWPGNVRELDNAIEYAFVLGRGPVLELEDLPASVRSPVVRTELPPRSERDQVDRDTIVAALQGAGGNRRLAAQRLGISRVTLWKWMKRHGVAFPDSRPGAARRAR